MDEFAAATKVEWREWGAAAFEDAAAADRPLLLSLSVPWSPECREMDERTYGEPRIAANINDGFVPVRVDADRRPRIRERYTMGGFPSTVFLTPSGEVLTGATYLGPDGFRDILSSVRETWEARGDAAGSIPRAVASGEPPAGKLSGEIEATMVDQLRAAYDAEYGGWGNDLKFPMATTIEFALVRERDQATRTLEAIRTHLRDTYDGGFYRYARNRDWSEARSEKLLDENAALIRAFAHGYRYTGETAYRETAKDAIDYLTTTLWTGEGFAASQAADGEYAQYEASDREDAETPFVDRTVFADRNGVAIDALCTFAAYTDDEEATRFAERARDYLLDTLLDDGSLAHYEHPDGTAPRGLLSDQARVLQGLTTSWQVLGSADAAQAIADWTIETLQTGGGSFHDGVTDGPGLLTQPLHPLDSTVALADGLLDLSALTGEERYQTVARDALGAYAGAIDRMGVEVASFAAAASRARNPTAIAVATPAGSDLHRAALRLADHESVVIPDAETAEAPAERRVDGAVTGIASSPGELEALLTDG
jgi:uncharacterized protein YyaL (SSP411 family)